MKKMKANKLEWFTSINAYCIISELLHFKTQFVGQNAEKTSDKKTSQTTVTVEDETNNASEWDRRRKSISH